MRQLISSKLGCGKACKKNTVTVPKSKSCLVINPKRKHLQVECNTMCLRLNCLSVKGAVLLLHCVLTYVLSSIANNLTNVLKGSQGTGSHTGMSRNAFLSYSCVHVHVFPEVITKDSLFSLLA